MTAPTITRSVEERSQQCSPSSKSSSESLFEREDGKFIGRDPREIDFDNTAPETFERSLTKAVRLKCLDCCVGVSSEVRRCVAVDCPLWPFRMGRNVFRKLSKSQRETPAGADTSEAGVKSNPACNEKNST